MPKLSQMSAIAATITLALSPAVIAQDDTAEITPEVAVVDVFTSADIDADGALSREEFISFVIMKSDQGDADYKSIKISGEYDDHFNTKDYNADGLLTAEELKPPVADDESLISEEDTTVDEPG